MGNWTGNFINQANMRRIWILAPALALASACQMEQEAPESSAIPQAGSFYAEMESPGEETKVFLTENLKVRWDADDRVSIFRKDTGNNEYRFAGETGAGGGAFEEAWTGPAATGDALPYNYAVYPYSAATTVGTDGAIDLTLPGEQAYREGSFGPGANTMVAVASDSHLTFKNVGAFLGIRLYGNGLSVRKVTLRGNKGEILSGPATVRMGLQGAPSVTMASEGTSEEVSVVCAEPVAVGADSEHATVFWFVLPPTTFKEGFTVRMEDSQGFLYEKSTSNKVVLERNDLLRMAAFEAVAMGFGIYPASGTPYVYEKTRDQMNIYEAEGNAWFRFLRPDLKMYELGPIPLDVAVGSTFTATLTATTAGTPDGTAEEYDLTVLSSRNGVLTLMSGAGDRFIIRF